MASGKNTGSKKSTAQASGQDHEQQAGSENGLGEELESVASEASESVQGAAGELSQNLRQQLTSQVTAQQERAVDTLETVTLLLHQAGEHARKEDKVTIAQYTDQAAGQVERLSKLIGDREPDQLITETKELAQKQPGLFVGGALLVGFLGARFLKSSAKAPQSSQQQGSAESGGSSSTNQSTNGSDTESGASGDSKTETPDMAETDDSIGSGAMTGVTDTSALAGTILEEDAAILEELEQEELLRREDVGLGETPTGDASNSGRDSETR